MRHGKQTRSLTELLAYLGRYWRCLRPGSDRREACERLMQSVKAKLVEVQK